MNSQGYNMLRVSTNELKTQLGVTSTKFNVTFEKPHRMS